MAGSINLAEVKFTQPEVTLYANVAQMAPDRITLRLESRPSERDMFRPNTPADLIVVAKGSVYRMKSRVLAEKDGVLIMACQTPSREAQRRENRRFPCELPVSYRAIYPDGRLGGWRNVQTLDVSIGGMCVRTPPSIDFPQMLDVMFALPDITNRSVSEIIAASHLPENTPLDPNSAIHVTARVAHRRTRADKMMAVGLEFTELSGFDQIRLVRFLAEVMPE